MYLLKLRKHADLQNKALISMSSDFQPPPKNLSILASVGGVVTAVMAIAILTNWSKQLSQTSIEKPEKLLHANWYNRRNPSLLLKKLK